MVQLILSPLARSLNLWYKNHRQEPEGHLSRRSPLSTLQKAYGRDHHNARPKYHPHQPEKAYFYPSLLPAYYHDRRQIRSNECRFFHILRGYSKQEDFPQLGKRHYDQGGHVRPLQYQQKLRETSNRLICQRDP